MAKQVKWRRGNTAQHSTFVGVLGEITINTDTWGLRVHDGTTVGGHVINVGSTNYSNANTLAYLTSNDYAQKSYVDTSISNLVAGAPGALNTLNELANALGNNANFSTTVTNSLSTLTSNAASQAGNIANITNGTATFANIIPSANVTYSLGNITHQWRDLFVSNTTIYIGGVPLSIDAGGNLLINGNAVSGSGTATGIVSDTTITVTNDDSNADISLLSGDDITLQGKDKTTSDSEGGDIFIYAGNGGDADLDDAGGSGGDITIRAGQGGIPSVAYNGGFGGTLDLYGGTGGDADPGNNRSARDGGRARLQAGSAGSNNGNVALGAEGGPVEITAGQTTLTDTNGGPVIITSGQAGANALAGYVEINIPGSDIGPGGSWYFTGTGRTLEAPQDGEIWQPNAGNLTVASAGNVFVRSYDGDQHEWQFGHNGDLTIPGNITMGPGSGRLISVVTPAPGIVNWEFGMDGNLTVPGNINHANGVNILSGLGSADFSNVSLIGTPGNLTIRAPAANTITTVTHEGGGAGYGVNTITGGLAGSPGFALIQPGWTVTGNNLVGTTTVISKTIDGYGTYTITTDTTEVDPFWTYDVYTFTSNTPSYSNLVISSGNIISGNSYVNFVANSSGDGNGYSTIELRPDSTVSGPDQYIIIDPTFGAPAGHIHIRAGGTQDDSSANLYLGGENSYFKIPHGSNPNVSVAANSYEWIFGSDGRLQLPDIGESSSEIYTAVGGISIKSPAYTELRYSSTDPANVSPTSNVDGYIWIANDGAHIQNYHGGEFNLEWIFGTNGNLSLPGSITFPDTTVQTTAWTGEINNYVVGYRDVPQVAAGNVTLGLTDAGKHYYSSASAPTTLTIPSNANVAFPVGTAITIVNAGAGNVSISKQVEAGLYLAGNATSATRTLTSYGMATLLKTATDQWFVNGTGLV